MYLYKCIWSVLRCVFTPFGLRLLYIGNFFSLRKDSFLNTFKATAHTNERIFLFGIKKYCFNRFNFRQSQIELRLGLWLACGLGFPKSQLLQCLINLGLRADHRCNFKLRPSELHRTEVYMSSTYLKFSLSVNEMYYDLPS